MSKLTNSFLILFLFIASVFSALAQNANNPVEVYTRIDDNTGLVQFFAKNPGHSPYQMQVSFTELINFQPAVNIPYYAVVQPGTEEMLLFTMKPKGQGKMSFKAKYIFEHGDPKVVAETNPVYLFPFQHGSKFRLSQGYHGKFSHQKKYAVDFEMPLGTPITAVHDGVVVDVKQDSDRGGADKSYATEGNYVLVYHPADGYYATYSHIRKNGAAKRLGEKVKAGEVVAYSGNTGWSAGPHLHFEVLKPGKMELATTPVNFQGQGDKEAIEPREGNTYYAFHPGKPAFKEDKLLTSAGSPTAAADLKKHVAKVATTNKVEVTDREVDGVIYFFVRNGFTAEKNVGFKFNLDNMKPLDKVVNSVKVPGNTEVFLFSATVDNPAKPANFGFSIKY
jgi:murein DD-endopeptidase MepM/ murein hydrolase activator NlpD